MTFYEYQDERDWREALRTLEQQLARDAVALSQTTVNLGEISETRNATVLLRVPDGEQRLEKVCLLSDRDIAASVGWTVQPFFWDGARVGRAFGVVVDLGERALKAGAPLVWKGSRDVREGGGVYLRFRKTGNPASLKYLSASCEMRRGVS